MKLLKEKQIFERADFKQSLRLLDRNITQAELEEWAGKEGLSLADRKYLEEWFKANKDELENDLSVGVVVAAAEHRENEYGAHVYPTITRDIKGRHQDRKMRISEVGMGPDERWPKDWHFLVTE